MLIREASLRKEEFDSPVKTVFIGGGTPSLLTPEQLIRMVHGLEESVDMSDCREFTVEANPGTLTKAFLETAAGLGINRLSLGMQAKQESLLKRLGRIHTFRDVCQSVELARKLNFENLNLDLIFGIPGQTIEEWAETLDVAIALRPTHISAYGLIPEKETPLFERLQKHEMELPDQEVERSMYDIALEKLAENGFKQYEISNFAVKGYECAHNIGYWTQVPYVGLGLSAASMHIVEQTKKGMKCMRRTNPDKMDDYYRMIREKNTTLYQIEEIGSDEARFETMMLALRMNCGISRERFNELHGIPIESCYGSELDEMQRSGLMQFKDGSWMLTRRGMDVQNSILVEFMKDL